MVDRDLKKLSKLFNAKVSQPSFDNYNSLVKFEIENGHDVITKLAGVKKRKTTKYFKDIREDGKVFPNEFAPILIRKDDKHEIHLMRYRVRPADSTQEIPTKYPIYNARLDMIEKRPTWKNIFLKNHGLVPFKSFYEWVEKDSKNQIVTFSPIDKDIMWAPVVFDEWFSPNNEIGFKSFAIVTTDPHNDVLSVGHDRSPIFLKESNIGKWLNTSELTRDDALDILSEQESVRYAHSFD